MVAGSRLLYIYIGKLFPTLMEQLLPCVYLQIQGVYGPTKCIQMEYIIILDQRGYYVCMISLYVYLEYMVILILYATIIVLYNILKDMCSFEIFSHNKDLVYLNISMSTYSKYWSCPPIYCSPSILDHQTSTHKHPEQSCTKQTKRYNQNNTPIVEKQVEKFVKLFYTSLRTHIRENHRNRI